MSIKMVVIGAFLLNTLFGYVCMMPMSHAEAMAMPEHEEMTMAPIFHADCADCPHHQEKQEPLQQSSCVGHCLSNAHNANLANVVTVTNQLAVALPAKVRIVLSNKQETFVEPLITGSPPPIPTSTVVLTL